MVAPASSPSAQARARADLQKIYRAAVLAVAPERLVASALKGELAGSTGVPELLSGATNVFVLAAGKAALGMAAELERRLGARLRAGLAVAPRPIAREAVSFSRTRVLEAAHPLPDRSSVEAADAALELVHGAGPGDLVVVGLSGGASALLVRPSPGITLDEKVAIIAGLLRAGASIGEFNTVRKHLSTIKGGQLLRAGRGARVLALILSDVPGNDLATIGSGPTAADPTTFAEAIGVLKRRKLWGRAPEPVREHLERGAAGALPETLKRGDPALGCVTNVIIGDNETAVEAAADAARAMGYEVRRGRDLCAEAEAVAAALACDLLAASGERPCVVAGGEPVVIVRGAGRGGRAQQCALAMALELERAGSRGRRVAALWAGTDGVDGPTDAAGAFVFEDTVARATRAGLDPEVALSRNDAYNLFRSLDDLLITGPTGTNVTDIVVGLVDY